MNSHFYQNVSDGGRMDATRLKLALFDEGTVRDIIALVNYRGSALLDDIYRKSTEADPPRALAIVGNDFVKYQDVAGVLLGYATIMLAGLRDNRMDQDSYATILKKAFGLPALTAKRYAERIETYDKLIKDTNADGSTSVMEEFNALYNKMLEGVRGVANQLGKITGLDQFYYWDQNQEFDVDAVFEMHQLGEAVCELNRRVRLMQAQASLNASFGMFRTAGTPGGGDPDDGDPDDAAEMMVGDVFADLGSKPLPASVYGPYADVAKAGRIGQAKLGKEILERAGVSKADDGSVDIAPVAQNDKPIANAVRRLLTSKGGKLALGAVTGGLGGMLLARALKRRSGLNGDPNTEITSHIAQHYGPDMAMSYATGDIDGIVYNAMLDGTRVDDSGDPELYGEALAEMEGDPEYAIETLGPEIGGVFSRWRANAATRRASRTARRVSRKQSRVANRNMRRSGRMNARNADRMRRQQAIDARRAMSVNYDQGYDVPGMDNYESAMPSDASSGWMGDDTFAYNQSSAPMDYGAEPGSYPSDDATGFFMP